MSEATKGQQAVVEAVGHKLAEQYKLSTEDSAESVVGELPRPRQIIDALKMLVELIMPVRDPEDLADQASVERWLDEKLQATWKLLLPEVERAIPYRWMGRASVVEGKTEAGAPAELASGVLETFFSQLPEIRELCVEDLRAAYRGDPAALTYLEIKLCYPGLLAIVAHRIAHALHQLGVPVLPRIMSEWIHTKTGVDIHPGAQIGKAFFIDHATGVVVGETARIGENVKLYQGVTLGARSFDLDEHGNPVKHVIRHPKIEDNVVIYSNATILGGDTVIGEGSIIGGNVFITQSVPPHSLVVRGNDQVRVKSLKKGSEHDWVI